MATTIGDPLPPADPDRLDRLVPGMPIVFGGNRVAYVSDDLAAAFRAGDHVVIDPTTGTILHIPGDVRELAATAVGRAVSAFAGLSSCSDDQITGFFDEFAARLADDATFEPIATANAGDVERAGERGRSTTRLVLTERMRADMVTGLRSWADWDVGRDSTVSRIDHRGWSVETRRAPLGVVAFVFEGRPNVFADAAGVVRTGNTVVFRIGSDALATAAAIVEHALDPAVREAGLPDGTVSLVASAAHAAGWALFSDQRLSLAVARGSGAAVAQLGAIARQAGVPVSLHGTGGAWVVAAPDADRERFASSVRHSLDRKVCNTLNVCCVTRDRAEELVPVFLAAVAAAADERGTGARVHATHSALGFVPDDVVRRRSQVARADGVHEEPFVSVLELDRLGHEWEWESSPEVSLHVCDDVADAVELCNRLSPRFVASLISESPSVHDGFYAAVDAPFVGDGFTRWVDGQYALDTPELGLSNWEGGRLLGRGAILSGDSVHTLRYRATITDAATRR